MKNKALKVIVLLLVITFIWGNSLLNNTQSHEVSNVITNKFISIMSCLFDVDMEYKMADKLIRKTAHFTQFAILGFFVQFCLELPTKRSELLGLIIAMTDEFIQVFSPGRTSSWKDICIDFAGYLVGIYMFKKVLEFFKNIRIHHNSNKR